MEHTVIPRYRAAHIAGTCELFNSLLPRDRLTRFMLFVFEVDIGRNCSTAERCDAPIEQEKSLLRGLAFSHLSLSWQGHTLEVMLWFNTWITLANNRTTPSVQHATASDCSLLFICPSFMLLRTVTIFEKPRFYP